MSQRGAMLPAGTAAYLFEEATRRRDAEERIVEKLRAAEYREAMVPSADYLAPYAPHLGAGEERELYRFVDRHGRISRSRSRVIWRRGCRPRERRRVSSIAARFFAAAAATAAAPSSTRWGPSFSARRARRRISRSWSDAPSLSTRLERAASGSFSHRSAPWKPRSPDFTSAPTQGRSRRQSGRDACKWLPTPREASRPRAGIKFSGFSKEASPRMTRFSLLSVRRGTFSPPWLGLPRLERNAR